MEFVGRSNHLAELDRCLQQVATHGDGVMIAARGRRQVGKSSLFTVFLQRADVANVFFSAVKNATAAKQLAQFQRDALDARPAIPDAAALFLSTPTSWNDVFGRLRLASTRGPIIVVIDEFPWAVEADPTIEGELQNAWDRHLQHRPVLLILVGSDMTMMERLAAHDRPLFGRAKEMTIQPLNPAEVGVALGEERSPMDVFDAQLITGGFPKLVREFSRHANVRAFMESGCNDENSDLVMVAQRTLDAEFPAEAQARRVLSTIGGNQIGHATFSSTVGALGEPVVKNAETALVRALRILADDKRVLTIETPTGTVPSSRLRRYRVADPYLRFWFRFLEPQLVNIARGRSDLATAAFAQGWAKWRGMAIEPLVHEAVFRLAPTLRALGSTSEVGSWWNRDNSVEVDLVARDSRAVVALGTVKWRARQPIAKSDLATLAAARRSIPSSADAILIAICPAGTEDSAGADLSLDANDLLNAWQA